MPNDKERPQDVLARAWMQADNCDSIIVIMRKPNGGFVWDCSRFIEPRGVKQILQAFLLQLCMRAGL